MIPPKEYWYRAYGQRYAAPLDEFDTPIGRGRVDVSIMRFEVISHTAKGVWLDYFGKKKFVLADARKKFACPTEIEAWESLIHRKQRQIKILGNQLEDAKIVKHMAEQKLGYGKVDEFGKMLDLASL